MKGIRSTLGGTLFVFSSLIQFSSQSGNDYCAEAAKALNDATPTGGFSFIPAKVAYECQISVPFHEDEATTTLQQMRLFLQFYSAQTYFAHPPTDELELYPVDMNKTLDTIESNIKDGKYPDEYMFNKDLFDLFGYYRDGHVLYMPLCYTAFTYLHPYSLISVAESPDHLPSVYGVKLAGGSIEVLDKVAKINGQEVISYLADMANTHPELVWIDPDARWNQLMMHYSDGKLQSGVFAQRYSYDDEDLIITWEGGSTTTVEWSAILNTESVSFDSTDNFYENVCIRPEDEIKAARDQYEYTQKRNTTQEEKIKKRSLPSFPHSLEKRTQNSSYYSDAVPVMSMQDNSLNLYLLDDQVGVLTMSTFQPGDSLYIAFSLFVTDAIKYLQKKGIEKVIIDVTGNGGGLVDLGRNAAMQFFPTTDHFFGTNMRWNPALATMLTKGNDPNGTYWDVGHYYRMDGSSFSSYKEFLGPVCKDGDYFTELARPNFVEENAETSEPLPASYPGPQPFETKNIILVSSGMCGSTCAVFSEAMTAQGVRSVAFGGRPRNGPMQGVGGIKGSQVLSFDEIAGWAYYLLGDNVSKYDFIPDITRVATLGARVNLRNSWRKNDQDTPIEFIYDPAEYKLSYTMDMLKYPQVMWAAARNVAWQGAKYLGNGTNYSTNSTNHSTNSTNHSTNSTNHSTNSTSNDLVAAAPKPKDKSDGIEGNGVDSQNNTGQAGATSWSSIGELIWQKIAGHDYVGELDLSID